MRGRRPMSPLERAGELALALSALAGSLRLSYAAGLAANEAGRHAAVAPDRVWSCLPVCDTRAVFIWGFAAFLLWLVAASLLFERRRCAYIAWSYALLTAVRSFFILLTPMSLPPEATRLEGDALYSWIGHYLTFKYDLFFSAHTALPFLAFLVFRRPLVRLSFLAFALTLALTVLLGRLHYSIDVFSAFFIVYALHLAEARWFQPVYCAWRDAALDRWSGEPARTLGG